MNDESFNPYHTWLGISPLEPTPHYYRLLGITAFETDPLVVENAADRQMAHLRTFQTGPRAMHAQQLLNEIAGVRAVLLDPKKKAAYDDQLRLLTSGRSPATEVVPPQSLIRRSSAKSNVPRRKKQGINPVAEFAKIAVGGFFGIFFAVLVLSYFAGIDLLGWQKKTGGQVKPRGEVAANANVRKQLAPVVPKHEQQPKETPIPSSPAPQQPQGLAKKTIEASRNNEASATKALQGEFTNSLGMSLKRIPVGEFMMGNDDTQDELLKVFPYAKKEWFVDAEKRHRVQITKAFYLGAYEVTVGQFRQFVNATGYQTEAEKRGGGRGYDSRKKTVGHEHRPKFTWQNAGWTQADDHPVVNVNWNDANAFCTWLSQREGKTYRLPTEAEWEYACRGGTQTRYYNGNDPEGLLAIGNSFDASSNRMILKSGINPLVGDDGHAFTAPVGQFAMNDFGLYDMSGNVWEWCSDWYSSDYEPDSPAADPTGPLSGSERVSRGGSWFGPAADCRSAQRHHQIPGYKGVSLGFRVALNSDQ